MNSAQIKKFQKTILDYYTKNARSFPWRETSNPYNILVSEVMLQQTQTNRVVAKYELFLQEFPDFWSLAKTSTEKLLSIWQGLGYNRRALSLKKAATIIVEKYKGQLPSTQEDLEDLPGIGPATASALRAFAFNQPSVFIETNIRTVFIDYFFKNKEGIHDRQLFPLIEKVVDTKNPRHWYYALMDYGVMLKKKMVNPSRRSLHYAKQSPFATSNRRIRGLIIKSFVAQQKQTKAALVKNLKIEKETIQKNLDTLVEEGFLKKKGRMYTFA